MSHSQDVANALRCNCATHLRHEFCDDTCECFSGVQRVTIARSERWADITTRIVLEPPDQGSRIDGSEG